MADNEQTAAAEVEVEAATAPKKTTWIYINRQVYPVHLPDPSDPGSFVVFWPVPDTKTHITPAMFKTHPFFDHFTRIQRSISKEPAPDYLQLDVGKVESGLTIHDLLNMNPEAIKGFLTLLAEQDPEMAAEIASSLPGVRRDRMNPPLNPLQSTKGPVSPAPPGA